MARATTVEAVALALALALALVSGCKKEEKKVKDEWETGKFVPPPPEKTEKLKPLPRFTCKAVGHEKWRFDPVASALAGGRVLVAGGRARKKWLTSAAILDPATGKARAAGAMKQTRALQTTVALADGRVLVVGGGSRALEVFDPKTRSWQTVGQLRNEAVKVAAAQLPDGKVYIAGGDLTGTRALCKDAYLWDPKGGLERLPALKKGVKGRAFPGPDGKVVLLAKLTGEDRASLLVTDPKKGTVEPFESDELLWKALRELGRSKGGDEVALAYTAEGKPVMPPTGLRGDALLRFFPSRLSWRTLGKLLRDHSGGVPVALSPDRILVVGGRAEESKVVEVCTKP
jgi:hypothetical protein